MQSCGVREGQHANKLKNRLLHIFKELTHFPSWFIYLNIFLPICKWLVLTPAPGSGWNKRATAIVFFRRSWVGMKLKYEDLLLFNKVFRKANDHKRTCGPQLCLVGLRALMTFSVTQNGKWRWTDESSYNYKNWMRGELNNLWNSEYCVALRASTGEQVTTFNSQEIVWLNGHWCNMFLAVSSCINRERKEWLTTGWDLRTLSSWEEVGDNGGIKPCDTTF